MLKNINTIGLAYRARKVNLGVDGFLTAIKNKNAYLVFLANDAAINTTKKVLDKACFYQIIVNKDFDSKTLSNIIGRNNVKVITIIDKGFANSLN